MLTNVCNALKINIDSSITTNLKLIAFATPYNKYSIISFP